MITMACDRCGAPVMDPDSAHQIVQTTVPINGDMRNQLSVHVEWAISWLSKDQDDAMATQRVDICPACLKGLLMKALTPVQEIPLCCRFTKDDRQESSASN